MTQPTIETSPAPAIPARSMILPWIIVLATITLCAVRWTGYATLPWLVVFAPLLAWIGITALAVVLSLAAAVISAAGRK